MPDDLSNVKLNKPWLVAVWPGMGHVAISAGFYLMSKLGMHLLAEFSARGLFEIEQIEVKHGLIHAARLPAAAFSSGATRTKSMTSSSSSVRPSRPQASMPSARS